MSIKERVRGQFTRGAEERGNSAAQEEGKAGRIEGKVLFCLNFEEKKISRNREKIEGSGKGKSENRNNGRERKRNEREVGEEKKRK